jgi:mono/diheme cytochrome c family protein
MTRRLSILAGAGALAFASLVVLSGFTGARAAGVSDAPVPGSAPASAVSFANDVRPIFEAKCVSCHGAADEDGRPRKEAYLDLTTYDGLMAGSEFGSVVEAGNADDSVLMDMIVAGDMPSQDDGPVDPLSEEEIDLIRRWIDEGAENN